MKRYLNNLLEFSQNINIEQIYWLLEMGLPRRKGDIYRLRNEDFRNLPPPVFFLSTGRTGTMWFADFFRPSKNVRSFHAIQPDLAIQAKFVYELHKNTEIKSEFRDRIISEIFLAGREQYLRYSYKTGNRLIETNNYMTLFAPQISKLIPGAKFVHLYRNPIDFVKSGLNRGWYVNPLIDCKLICPLNLEEKEKWKNASQVQKISWLWNEINTFVENFKENISEDRILSFNFNELTRENIQSLVQFMDVDLKIKNISTKTRKKKNAGRKDRMSFSRKDEFHKIAIIEICGKLADKLGYKL